MDPELLLYIDKAQLGDDETHLIFNPPCKVYSQITEFISPNPNNVDTIVTPKPQNCFFLYRKNYNAKHKSPRNKKDWKILSKEAGNAWHNESNEVKSYFKVLAKLALEKHKLTYENILLKNFIFISQQPKPQQNQIDNNDSAVLPSSYLNPDSFSSTYYCTNDNTSLQLKLQQKQNDNLNNNDCAPSSSSPHTDPIFSCTSDNTSLPHFMTQQLELQQKQSENFHKNNNNDYAVSSSSHPYSTFSYKDVSIISLHFRAQQPEIQQKQKDNIYKENNNEHAVSSLLYPHSISFDFDTNADWNTIINYFRL
ncbi:6260_t:CDS:1 [Entrophospora sp. SA101]|nr:8017_t:CDS:1 [Entrophospora sp. SA101]CAJ0648089.1 6260_t:CDS:1 [Entrophospora sp. SA101]CAJ0833486.1 573_t:CDS:1 [Entrophospora sp. SA101]CAJ0842681.1 17715_t:CDS:1 [Entrophospora sp. SA101]CAJ0908571.1 7086_t:CDS:1 [Entrophospora sp. SA101]